MFIYWWWSKTYPEPVAEHWQGSKKKGDPQKSGETFPSGSGNFSEFLTLFFNLCPEFKVHLTFAYTAFSVSQSL